MASKPKYRPGSFTKNFAWGGKGFKNLFDAIRSGYRSSLAPVRREDWRENSGINDSSLDLIPINFFLHNFKGRMSVDELVYQAVRRPHTIEFDRLALFAFHLNQVGTPPLKGPSRPALWANEFVKEVLWQGDAWRRSALDQQTLDDFIASAMIGQGDVKIKSRNNYRYFFELAGYLPSVTENINTGAQSWMASALYLAWDRYLLDGGREASLLEYVKRENLYKLLGVSETSVSASAVVAVRAYQQAGALKRFASTALTVQPATISNSVGSRKVVSIPPTLPEADWLDQDGSDEIVERFLSARLVQKRNRKTAAQLRLHYKNKCMFCGVRLQVGEDRFYSEAAHVKPLGKPHNGPDKSDNLLVLCPNHHLQFDRGIIRLKNDGENLRLISSVPSDPLDQTLVVPRHAVDRSCIDWHYHWFSDKR